MDLSTSSILANESCNSINQVSDGPAMAAKPRKFTGLRASAYGRAEAAPGRRCRRSSGGGSVKLCAAAAQTASTASRIVFIAMSLVNDAPMRPRVQGCSFVGQSLQPHTPGQLRIGSYQGETDHGGCGGQEQIAQIGLRKFDAGSLRRHGKVEGRFPQWHEQENLIQPLGKALPDSQSLAALQVMSFPDRDWRQVQFILRILELPPNGSAQFFGTFERPDPDMGVEQQFHGRRVAHLSKAPTGRTMSPEISSESLIQPSQDCLGAALTGTTSATGFPKRVTRIGLRVRRTSSITARQVTLNFETAISCCCSINPLVP